MATRCLDAARLALLAPYRGHHIAGAMLVLAGLWLIGYRGTALPPASRPAAHAPVRARTDKLFPGSAGAQAVPSASGVGSRALGAARPAPYSRRLTPYAGDAICRPPAGLLPPAGPCGDRWRIAAGPNPSGRLAAAPSVSVGTIWRAFWAAGSPLADNGPRRDGKTYAEYLWDDGKAAGIDPAVVMGIFQQESNYGTRGMAVLTHSIGNARPSVGDAVACNGDGCYAAEPDWFSGIDEIYRLLRQYVAWGYNTADQLIPVWAPAADDNDDAAFAYCVHSTMQALYAASD